MLPIIMKLGSEVDMETNPLAACAAVSNVLELGPNILPRQIAHGSRTLFAINSNNQACGLGIERPKCPTGNAVN